MYKMQQMCKRFFFFSVVSILLGIGAGAQTNYASLVNPFIGTGGHGHTYPGASMPFGMMQLSPDTRLEGWDGCGGYHYSDSIMYGFSHTHLSGTGIPDYCDILFAPYVSKENFRQAKEGDDTLKGYASKFSHANEKAEPGYYSVKLDDENILAEMTATLRAITQYCALHGVPVASHDDDTVEKVTLMDQLGANISEFPVTLEAA